MTHVRRSPYLMLGLPVGASKGDGARAFARATRRLRSMPNPPYDIEDLNWALHAVEQRVEDPNTSIDDYRMPADPDVYVIPDGPGIFNPGTKPLPRRSAPSTERDTDTIKEVIILEIASSMAREIEGAPLPALHRHTKEGS